MRRPLALALVLPVLGLAFIGCGKQEPVSTPVACLGGPDQWFDALDEISRQTDGTTEVQVRLGGETLLSDCIPADQPAGQHETVGKNAVTVATRLAAGYENKTGGSSEGQGTADNPEWEAGYLVGALERGAERTQGIHATLIERVRSAATNGLDQLPQSEQGSYRAGYESGLESG